MAKYLYEELNPVLPEGWRANVDYLANDWTPWNPDKLVVHYGGNAVTNAYTGIAREKTVLRIYERSHLSRGWNGIAYNYAIGMSGTLYILRGEQRSGATSGDYEGDGVPENEEARAILFLLGGAQVPTPEALATFRKLWALTPASSQTVIGHRDVKGTTSCPGGYLLDYVHTKQYKEAQPMTTRFSDVPKDHKFYDDIEWMAANDITRGAGNDAFGNPIYKPDAPVTREHMAAFLHRFFTLVTNIDVEGIVGPQGPAGPQGPPGLDGTVDVFVDGDKVA